MLSASRSQELLEVPPFPGSRPLPLKSGERAKSEVTDRELSRLMDRVKELRVGGTYWGVQPKSMPQTHVLVRVRNPSKRARYIEELGASWPIVVWLESGWASSAADFAAVTITGDCDPWHVLGGAAAVVADADDQVATLAMIAGADVTLAEGNGLSAVRERFRETVSTEYRDPFDGELLTFEAAAELCGSWRHLIDSNRQIGMAIGFAFWKRRTVAPLLWGGQGDVRFSSRLLSSETGESAAVWRSKADAPVLDELDRNGTHIIEVEDGFIRSSGLGANCVPPLSIIVDQLGIYFDPSRPSELEHLLQEGSFSAEILERARRLRERIVELGVTKYGVGEMVLSRRNEQRRQLLAVGQVDDDRAVALGGGPPTNLDLLRQVRSENPDAYVMYKPHPDVEAGHRSGAMRDAVALDFADEVVREAPISSLFSLADEIHVNTSIAGFEALLRGKAVTTYGVPFYAGWGLTRDLGPVPARRTARRDLDELVAAALIQYARYLDPVTGLPCPPEVLVRRLGQDKTRRGQSGIVQLRKLQGRLNRAVSALRR